MRLYDTLERDGGSLIVASSLWRVDDSMRNKLQGNVDDSARRFQLLQLSSE